MKWLRKIGAAIILGCVSGIVALLIQEITFMHSIELKTFDYRARQFSSPDEALKDIVVIALDQNSIDHFSSQYKFSWPWPRDFYGEVLEFLTKAGARAVVFDLYFSEPDITRSEYDPGETDQKFSEAISLARMAFLPVIFNRSKLQGIEEEAALLALQGSGVSLTGVDLGKIDIPERPFITLPIPEYTKAAAGLGAVNIEPDPDGIYRRLPLFFKYKGITYPSLSLQTAMFLRGSKAISIDKRGFLDIGGQGVFLGRKGELLLVWHGPGGGKTYRYYPFVDVFLSAMKIKEGGAPLVPSEEFKGKTVFIGSTAPALFDLKSTPMSTPSEPFPSVEIHVAALDNLLKGQSLREAEPLTIWGTVLGLSLIVALSAILAQRAVVGGILGAIVLAAYIFMCFLLFKNGIVHQLVPGVSGGILSYLGATLFNFITEGQQKRRIHRAFQFYLHESLVSQLTEDPGALRLGGERKELTVFFSDIKGFTTISETMDPEKLVHLLNRYFEVFGGAILAHKGYLDKFVGDAVMAIFGAPAPVPDHAVQACLAAIECQERLEALRKELEKEGLPPIYARIGVNTGPMVVGNIGSSSRFNYTVIGDEVNVASRLESANKEWGTYILIGDETFRRAQKEIDARRIGAIQVKGRNEPVKVYEVMCRKGGLTIPRIKVVELYNQGLTAFEGKQMGRAEGMFMEALKLDENDGPSKVYLQRCLNRQTQG